MNKTIKENPSLSDQRDSFGWISIGLHWLISIAVIVIWFVGQSISTQPAINIDARRSLHVFLGLLFWIPILVRIYWRFKNGHPRAHGQSDNTHRFAKLAHYLMLVLLGSMLLSGPMNAWINPSAGLAKAAFFIHSNVAIALVVLVIFHVLAAMKHLMFHDDETLARIFVPRSDLKKQEEKERA